MRIFVLTMLLVSLAFFPSSSKAVDTYDCSIEDVEDRWNCLKEKRAKELTDPDFRSEHCAQCEETCAQDNPEDPLHEWRCKQCKNECSINSEE